MEVSSLRIGSVKVEYLYRSFDIDNFFVRHDRPAAIDSGKSDSHSGPVGRELPLIGNRGRTANRFAEIPDPRSSERPASIAGLFVCRGPFLLSGSAIVLTSFRPRCGLHATVFRNHLDTPKSFRLEDLKVGLE